MTVHYQQTAVLYARQVRAFATMRRRRGYSWLASYVRFRRKQTNRQDRRGLRRTGFGVLPGSLRRRAASVAAKHGLSSSSSPPPPPPPPPPTPPPPPRPAAFFFPPPPPPPPPPRGEHHGGNGCRRPLTVHERSRRSVSLSSNGCARVKRRSSRQSTLVFVMRCRSPYEDQISSMKQGCSQRSLLSSATALMLLGGDRHGQSQFRQPQQRRHAEPHESEQVSA